MEAQWIVYIVTIVQNHTSFLILLYIALFISATVLYLKCTARKQPNKPSKRKYKVSINGNKLLFQESKLSSLALSTLKLLARKCELYVVTLVKSDEEEAAVRSLCLSSEIVPVLVQQHVLVFCDLYRDCCLRLRMWDSG
eukprot:TRINITY_DN4401_c0_g1_i2.p1 TRINITY_DN4401_c0_g1~~TRINITY_DN4401_c0_g1_i2.p1  ORF type:complete len:139 (+),score=20.66 TRINITY_DN4401_c0_g1_i2:142-558(+)